MSCQDELKNLNDALEIMDEALRKCDLELDNVEIGAKSQLWFCLSEIGLGMIGGGIAGAKAAGKPGALVGSALGGAGGSATCLIGIFGLDAKLNGAAFECEGYQLANDREGAPALRDLLKCIASRLQPVPPLAPL